MSLCTSDVDVDQIEEGLKQWPADSDLHMFDVGYEYFSSHSSAHPLTEVTHPMSMAAVTQPHLMNGANTVVSLNDPNRLADPSEQ